MQTSRQRTICSVPRAERAGRHGEAYRERRKYWHLEEVARDKARNARRDMTKWEADWLLGATAFQVGIEAVVALGVKDADVREKLLYEQINLHSSSRADDGAARHRQVRTAIA